MPQGANQGVERGANTRPGPESSRQGPRWRDRSLGRSHSGSRSGSFSPARSASRSPPFAEAGIGRGANTRPGRPGTSRPHWSGTSPSSSRSRSRSQRRSRSHSHSRSPSRGGRPQSRRPDSSKSRSSSDGRSRSLARSGSRSRSPQQPSRGQRSKAPKWRDEDSQRASSSRPSHSHGRSSSPEYKNLRRGPWPPRFRDRSGSMEAGYRTDSDSLTLSRRSPSRGYSSSPPARNIDKGKKKLTEEERSCCPDGDTRWPPPGEYVKPLHFLYKDNDVKKKLYYHLIYQNTAFETQNWMRELDDTAAEATSKTSAEDTPLITIMNALNSKKLRPISDGKRGKVWILDEGCKETWTSIKSMMVDRGAVRTMLGWETFEVLGVCLKGNKDDILLVSWIFPADQVRPPLE